MSAPRHPIVLIDLDHTLLDSDTSESLSYTATMEAAGVADPASHLDAYLAINGEMWAAVEQGEIAAGDVRLARFRRFVAERGLDADPGFLADTYAAGLAANGELLPGAIEALEAVGEVARLVLATNGVSDIQRTRIERLGIGGFFDAVVISSEVGVSKPGPGFFDVAFDMIGSPGRDGALMVGDSLTSDMRGGIDAGLATCWFNRSGGVTDLPVTYEIVALDLLPAVVLG